MTLKTKFAWLAVLLATAVLARPALAQDDVVASIRKAGEVKAAMASAPPLLGVSPTGKPSGPMADITNLALKGMGLPEFTAVMTGWSALVPSLQAHHVDLIVPGMQANEARCKAALFSAPVFLQRNGLYVRAGNPKGITSLAQIASKPDLKVAVVPASNPEALAVQVGIKPDQIVRVADDQAGASTVTGGRADVYVTGQFTIRNLKQMGVDVVADMQGPFVVYGIVFRKEDTHFRDAMSKEINSMRSNGKLKDIWMKYAVDNGIAEKDMAANMETLAKLQRVGEVMKDCD